MSKIIKFENGKDPKERFKKWREKKKEKNLKNRQEMAIKAKIVKQAVDKEAEQIKKRKYSRLSNEEIGEGLANIIEKIFNGIDVSSAVSSEGWNISDFYRRIKKPEYEQEYTLFLHARESLGEYEVGKLTKLEQMLLNGEVGADTFRVLADVYKWKAAKFYPKMYGDKQVVDLNSVVTHSVQISQEKIRELNNLMNDAKLIDCDYSLNEEE